MSQELTTTSSEQFLALQRQKAEIELSLSPVGKMVAQMEAVNKIADLYAKSDFVPAAFKGKPENCAIAINMAIRMNMDPTMVMQNIYVVKGTPSLSSKMIIAMINNCGKFEPIRFESNGKQGDDFGMRAYTFRVSDTDHEFRLESAWVTMKMVKAEGWGPKWHTMPQQMFHYRTAVFWTRVHAPEITMGIMSTEEVQEPSYVTAPPVDAQYEDVTDRRSLAEVAMMQAMAEQANKAQHVDTATGEIIEEPAAAATTETSAPSEPTKEKGSLL